MLQKIIIAVLSLALAAVGGAFAFSLWAPKAVAPVPPAPSAAASRFLAPVAASLAPLTTGPIVSKSAVVAAEKPGGTAFAYEYVPPKNAALQETFETVRDRDLLRKLPEIQSIDGLLTLPAPLRYLTAECKSVDAFYEPERREIVLCYETLEMLYAQGEATGAAGELGDGFPEQYVLANVRFILLHETGHALVDLLELPITGREEDAVDQLATVLMQKFASVDETPTQTAENLRMAATWFLQRSKGQYNLDAYADEHALGEQRYFNLQCLIYGHDPVGFVSIVSDGDLPEARAARCPAEVERVERSWLRLLLPHIAPKFQMTEQQAQRFFEQRERQRSKSAGAPYVR
ncbi:MAG: DUF4344 domain-containing metallopeptidase [Pseudomonas sp.]|nr:DUF4344 domain-containing metallopeptidase [Pseudomonas sp.]